MQFFRWIADNWQAVCAWATGLYLAIHIGRLFASIVIAINSITKRAVNAEATLITMATNHLPHIQKAVETTNKILEDMRDDLQKVLKIEEDE